MVSTKSEEEQFQTMWLDLCRSAGDVPFTTAIRSKKLKAKTIILAIEVLTEAVCSADWSGT